jgi:hypothetical protein
MKAEAMAFLILSSLVFAAFHIPKLWLARNPDPLSARYRALGVFTWVLALVLLTAIILHFAIPASAPGGLITSFLACQLIFALFYRQRLCRHLSGKPSRSE